MVVDPGPLVSIGYLGTLVSAHPDSREMDGLDVNPLKFERVRHLSKLNIFYKLTYLYGLFLFNQHPFFAHKFSAYFSGNEILNLDNLDKRRILFIDLVSLAKNSTILNPFSVLATFIQSYSNIFCEFEFCCINSNLDKYFEPKMKMIGCGCQNEICFRDFPTFTIMVYRSLNF